MSCPCEQNSYTSPAATYNSANCGNVTPCPTTPQLPCPNPVPCDETFNADCVYYNPSTPVQQSCAGLKNGDNLSTIIQKLDARICQCCGKGATTTSPLMVFYVDGNNTNTGDGSILNPFQTIDLAYNAVLGTGTIAAPQHQNVAISVAAYNYTTNINIYLGYTTCIFAEGAIVNYTGTTYFIDSSVVAGASPSAFKITGGLTFKTSTGGFLRNQGAAITNGAQKQIYIEAYNIWGSTNASGTIPLIVHNMTSPTGYGPIFTSIQLQHLGSILSAWETDIAITNGGYFYLDLNGGQLGNGIDPIAGGYTGVAGRNLISYTGSTTMTISTIDIGNGSFYGLIFSDMVSVSGNYVYLRFHDLTAAVANASITKPNTFINIGTIALGSYSGGDGQFLLRNLNFDQVCFNTATIVNYTGTGTLTSLEMQDCVFHNGLTISTNINLGQTAPSAQTVCVNVLRGQLHIAGLPVYSGGNPSAIAGGLVKNDIYTNGQGMVLIVY